MIRITKFHLILIGIVIIIAGIFYYQIEQKKQQQKPVPIITDKEEIRKQFEDEKIRQYEQEEKEKIAREAVAVAGEYYMAAKKEGRDITKGQEILSNAKENLNQNNFDIANTLAREAIDEFKNAPSSTKYYTVQRGDTLWTIAKKPQIFGRGAKWVTIWRANESKIPDFDIIYAGTKLYIPRGQ